jgi:ribosomal protein S18 acetylase RimI-like enzyme
MAGFYRCRHLKARHQGHVWGVYVAQAERGRGAGRALLRALLDRVRALGGIEQVSLTVTTQAAAARALYLSLGFQSYGLEPRALRVAGRDLDQELMFLRL